MSLKKRAEACFRQNKLTEAKKLYTRAYQANRNDIDALFMLGAIHGQQNSLTESETCFRKVVASHPDYYPAWDNLGVTLMMQGKNTEAESCYRKSIRINPDYAQGHNNLGNLLKIQGHYTDAISCFRRALQINPGYSEAHNSLGGLYFDQDEPSQAVSCYKNALQANPDYLEAYINLGNALHKLENDTEAIACFQHVLQIQPENTEAHRYLGTLYWDLNRPNDAVDNLYRVLMTAPDAIDTFPAKAALLAVRRIPGLQDLIDTAKQQGYAPLEKGILECHTTAVFQDSLLLSAMLRIILMDLDVENLLTKTRQLCLHSLLHQPAKYFESLFGANHDFIAALASQCFNNEYIYPVSDNESAQLEQLDSELTALCTQRPLTDTNLQRRLIVLGMYRPLSTHKDLGKHLRSRNKLPAYLQKVIRQQILEPAQEARIRGEIVSLTAIKDTVSLKVGRQYDEAPFPRWLNITLSRPRPYPTVLQSQLKDIPPVHYPEKRIKILVAGCGTGAHALQTAAQYADADVLAIDISINCLAYAKRKADEMGVKNVTFKHADILELGEFGERFHIIEVVGVLQTMNEPDTALRILVDLLHPRGFIKIGLYSKQARRHISAASTNFKRRGFTAKDDDIRRLRQEVIAMDEHSPIRKTAVNLKDFYSMSECRNAYFLVHEVEHSLTDVSRMLDRARLEFLCFSFPDQRADTQFDEVCPDNQDQRNLDAWNTVETRYPDTFINMYNFWCRHRP